MESIVLCFVLLCDIDWNEEIHCCKLIPFVVVMSKFGGCYFLRPTIIKFAFWRMTNE